MPGLRPQSPRTAWGRVYEAVFEAVISVVLGIIGGYYADGYFGTGYTFLLIGLVLGGAAATRRLLKIGPGSSAGPHGTQDSSEDAPDRASNAGPPEDR